MATPEPLPEPEPIKTGPVKVGLLLPLSGNAAAVGRDLLNAALLAMFDVPSSNIELLPKDTGGTPEGARQAAREVIAQEAELIIGPLYSTSVTALKPIAEAAGLSIVAFSNDSSIAGGNVFTLGFGPEEQVRRVTDFAQSQGYAQIAAIGPDDIYGARSMNAWRRQVAGAAQALLYAPNENGMAQTIRQISNYDARKSARDREFAAVENLQDPASRARRAQLETLDTVGTPPFDALMIADNSNRLNSVTALLTYYDVDPAGVKLLGTMLWLQDQRILNTPELEGAWIATLPPDRTAAFSQRFARAYGSQPNALAGLAYDATAMAALIGQQDRDFPVSLLTDPAGFIGQSGIFRLNEQGIAEHGMSIVEVRGGEMFEVSPAPDNFRRNQLVQ